MKQLSGSARGDTRAAPEDAYAFVRDVEAYPRWHGGVVREVRLLSRSGERVDRALAVLHAQVGPLDRDFEVVLDVHGEPPREVRLDRVAHEPGDSEQLSMLWTLGALPSGGTTLTLALSATLDVPRLVPLPGGTGDLIAGRFVSAAVAALGA